AIGDSGFRSAECSHSAPRSSGNPAGSIVLTRPPTRSRASSTRTDTTPASRRRRAAPIPAAPAPITATSTSDGTPVIRSLAAGRSTGYHNASADFRNAAMRLTDFNVLTFDCYGTLIDWETGIVTALRPRFGSEFVERSRNDILAAFARLETAQEAKTPDMIYPELLALVHRQLAEEWGIAATAADHRAFGGSVGNLPGLSGFGAALAHLQPGYTVRYL